MIGTWVFSFLAGIFLGIAANGNWYSALFGWLAILTFSYGQHLKYPEVVKK